MDHTVHPDEKKTQYRYLLICVVLCICWLISIGSFLLWEVHHQYDSINDLAATEARASFHKDLVYRRWASGHGGVYVPISETTPPNPYLSRIKERDISSPSGKKLTLVNPAYMTRQVHELGNEQYGIKGHITSLKPIRPGNKADEWETKALKAFEQGEVEVSSVSMIGDTEYLRLMRPMIAEEGCLKCHGYQGYKEGDLRGGISVSVPLAVYHSIAKKNVSKLVFVHIVITLVGLFSLLTSFLYLNKKSKERSFIELALRESEQKFKNMFERAPLSYQSLDEKGNLLEVNQTWLHTLGYKKDYVLGKNFSEFLTPEWRDHFTTNFPRLKNTGEIPDVEFEMVKKDGSSFLISLNGRIDRDENGDFIRTHCVFYDITEQRDAEVKLRQDFLLNKAIADISKELLSEDYDLKRVSDATLDAAKKITNSDHGFVSSIDKKTLEIVGHTLTDMFGDACRMEDQRITFPIGDDGKYGGLSGHALNTKKAFFTSKPKDHSSSTGIPEGHIHLKNYMAVPVLMGDKLLGLIALSNSAHDYSELDIHAVHRIAEIFALALHRQSYEEERSKMELNLRQLRKNEAIGALAGGIAHDFNNILFPIIGFAEMLEDDISADSPLRENVNEILTGANRAKELVKQILAFSRQAEQEVKPLKPHLIIREVIKLIQSTIPKSIEIKENIDPDSRTIMADPTQIHQVAMNLVTNSYHAMQNSGGTLSIGLKNIDFDDYSGHLRLDAGPYILLSIEDTGTGMDQSTIEKIFDPYFTTKPKGKGTGLGLSVVQGIISNYGGDIEVKSIVGQGSTINIYLPAFESEDVSKNGFEQGIDPKGSETILIVDDEIAILRLEQKILERLGYDVHMAESSEEALSLIRNHPDKYDLLISDMTMPKMTGDLLAQEVKKTNPDIPIIICTGFTENLTPERASNIGIDKVLMKPVIKTKLAKAIRDVFD